MIGFVSLGKIGHPLSRDLEDTYIIAFYVGNRQFL